MEAAAWRLAGVLDQQNQAPRTNGLNRLYALIATVTSQKELAKGVFEVLANVVGDCVCWIRLRDTLRRGTESWQRMARLAVNESSWEHPRTPRFRRMGEGIAGRAAEGKDMMLFNHPTFDDALKEPLVADIINEDSANRELVETFRSIACVPLCTGTELVGTLLVCRTNFGLPIHCILGRLFDRTASDQTVPRPMR